MVGFSACWICLMWVSVMVVLVARFQWWLGSVRGGSGGGWWFGCDFVVDFGQLWV